MTGQWIYLSKSSPLNEITSVKRKKNSVRIDIVSKVAKKLPISKLFRQSETLSAPAFDVLLHLYQLIINNEKRFRGSALNG